MNKCFEEKDKVILYKDKEYSVLKCILPKESFISKHVSNYRTYYVDDKYLLKRIEAIRKHENQKTNGEVYKELIQTYIPNKQNIKSGDFGEIVSSELYSKVIENDDNEVIVYNPKKIRWKEDRERAEGKTDVMLIGKKGEKYLIVALEVKTKSNKSDFDPITDMIEGIYDDSVSRLAKTIDWTIEKGMQNVEDDELKTILELKEDYRYKPNNFNYVHNGVLVIEESLFSSEINRNLGSIIKVHGRTLNTYKKYFEKLNVRMTNKIIEFKDLTDEDIKTVCSDKKVAKKVKELYELSQKHMDNFDIKFLIFSNLKDYLDDMYKKIVDIGDYYE